MNEQDIQDKILAKGAEFEALGFRERRESAETDKDTDLRKRTEDENIRQHLVICNLIEKLNTLHLFGKLVFIVAMAVAFISLVFLITGVFSRTLGVTFLWASLFVASVGRCIYSVAKVSTAKP